MAQPWHIPGSVWVRCLRCLAEARSHNAPDITRLVDRSSLNLRAIQDTARMCRSDKWALSPRVVDRARRIFSGFGQEKIVEDALQKCRDVEQRRSGAKSIKQWRVYETPSVHNVIATYGRQEVALETTPVAVSLDGQTLFRHTGTFSAVDFSSLLGPQTWATFDAHSAKVCFSAACRSEHVGASCGP